jgi:hypothetical protein
MVSGWFSTPAIETSTCCLARFQVSFSLHHQPLEVARAQSLAISYPFAVPRSRRPWCEGRRRNQPQLLDRFVGAQRVGQGFKELKSPRGNRQLAAQERAFFEMQCQHETERKLMFGSSSTVIYRV